MRFGHARYAYQIYKRLRWAEKKGYKVRIQCHIKDDWYYLAQLPVPEKYR